jgi:hypothetical protein
MVTTEEVLQDAAKMTLSISASVVDATKNYGLSFGEDCIKLVGGSSSILANQLVPGGINFDFGDKTVDVSKKISEGILDTASSVLKCLKGKIHS